MGRGGNDGSQETLLRSPAGSSASSPGPGGGGDVPGSAWNQEEHIKHREAVRMLQVAARSEHPLRGVAASYLKRFSKPKSHADRIDPETQHSISQTIFFAVSRNCSPEAYAEVLPDFNAAREMIREAAGDESFAPAMVLMTEEESREFGRYLENEELGAGEEPGEPSLLGKAAMKLREKVPQRGWAMADVVCLDPYPWTDERASARLQARRFPCAVHELVHVRAFLAELETEEDGQADKVIIEALTETVAQRVLRENGIPENQFKDASAYNHIAGEMDQLLSEAGVSTREALLTSIKDQESFVQNRLGRSVPELRRHLILKGLPGFLGSLPRYARLLAQESRNP